MDINFVQRYNSRPWSYGSWIYNYLCNQCLSPLRLWVRTPFRRGVLDTTLGDKVCQLLTTGQWFSPRTLVSSTNKTDRHDITNILLKLALSTINQNQTKQLVGKALPIHRLEMVLQKHTYIYIRLKIKPNSVRIRF